MPEQNFDRLLERVKTGASLSRSELQAVRDELASPNSATDPYTLLHIIGKVGDKSSRAMIDRILNTPPPTEVWEEDEQEMLRRICVQILAHWWVEADALDVVLRSAKSDPSDLVRMVAASGLGALGKGHEVLRAKVAAELLTGLQSESNVGVRGGFYRGMLELLGVPATMWPLATRDLRPDDIDEDYVARIRTLASD